MCGRFTETQSKETLIKRFRVQKNHFLKFSPSYNIAPAQEIPIVIKKDLRELHGMKWGLVPSWAKDPSIGNHMINARAETLSEKMSFKLALKWRRCLVLADGFFEWKKEGEGKGPYFIQQKDHMVFAFAGLWSSWQDPNPGGELLHSCTIVTTEANDWMKSLHDRMPVILSPAAEEIWMNPDEDDEKKLLAFLKPCGNDQLKKRLVSKKLNDPSNNF